MAEAFVNTLKRDYVSVSPLPDAETALRLFEDYNVASLRPSFYVSDVNKLC